MPTSLIVIDGFLEEPELLRQRALGLKYENAGTYPGRNSIERTKIMVLRKKFHSSSKNECVSLIRRSRMPNAG